MTSFKNLSKPLFMNSNKVTIMTHNILVISMKIIQQARRENTKKLKTRKNMKKPYHSSGMNKWIRDHKTKVLEMCLSIYLVKT